jgi:hypothetical protein
MEAVEWTAAVLVAITLLVAVAFGLRGNGGEIGAALTGTLGRFLRGLANGAGANLTHGAAPLISLTGARAPTLGLPTTLLAMNLAPTKMLLGAGALALTSFVLLSATAAAPRLIPAAIGGAVGGSFGATLINARISLVQALQRAMQRTAPRFLQALQYSRSTTIRVASLRGQLAEVRYFRLFNRITTFIRTGYWIQDADVVYARVVGALPPGGRAPLIDFVLRPLRSRNPITLLRGLLRGQSIWEPYNSNAIRIVSSKTGSSAFRQLRLFFANRLNPRMDPLWRAFIRGKQRFAITDAETLAAIKNANVTTIMRQLGLNRAQALRFIQNIRNNTVAVGARPTLDSLVTPRSTFLSKMNPRSLASAGGWVKAGVIGGIISGGISAFFNIKDVIDGKMTVERAIGNIVADTIGGVGAALIGMYIGGVIGSFIPIPIVGTLVGMLIGFVVGFAIGWLYDTFIRNYVAEAVTKVAEFGSWAIGKVAEFGSWVSGTIADGWNATVNVVKDGLDKLGQGYHTVISWLGWR